MILIFLFDLLHQRGKASSFDFFFGEISGEAAIFL
jgi:hypothetical protein